MNPVVCNIKVPVTFVEFFCKGRRDVSPSHISCLRKWGPAQIWAKVTPLSKRPSILCFKNCSMLEASE
jgi:hypothetical protein